MSASPPTTRIVRRLLGLAAPVALSRLGVMGMGVVDTVAVGQLAPDDLSLLALGWAPTGVLLVTGIGLLLGVQVLTARVIGRGRPRDAGAVWKRGVRLALLAGTAGAVVLWAGTEGFLLLAGIAPELATGAAGVTDIMALSLPLHFGYMACAYFVEAIERPRPATAAIWLANLVNLAVNLALVPRYGAAGSATATVAARAVMFVALWLWIRRSVEGRAFGVHDVGAGAGGEDSTYSAILRVGSASALSQFAEAGAFSVMTVLAGRLGATAVATYQVLLNTTAVVFMVSLGVSAATSVLAAIAWGGRDARETARVGWIGLTINTALMVAAAAFLLLFPSAIAAGFTSDAELSAAIAALLPMIALVLIPDGGQAVAAHALRARGDNWFPTASHLASYVVVMPPLAWWLAEVGGRDVRGLVEAIAVGSLLSVSILLARMRRLAAG
jgi:MATE family multidrug resistance protein